MAGKITGTHDLKPVIEKNKLQPFSAESPVRLRVISASSWGYYVVSLAAPDKDGAWTLQLIESEKWNAKGKSRQIPISPAKALEIERLANAVFSSNLPKDRFPPPETAVMDVGAVLIERPDGSYLIRDRIAPNEYEKEIRHLLKALFKLI